MLALADQPLVELAGEQGDLGLTKVMAEGATGEADLLTAAGDQQGRIQLGQAFWGLEEGRGPCGSGAMGFGPAAEGLGVWGQVVRLGLWQLNHGDYPRNFP